MAFLGEIKLFAGDYAPRGWKFCDGQELGTWEHLGLHSIVAVTQGENAIKEAFYLPDLREAEKTLDNCRYIICTEGNYINRAM